MKASLGIKKQFVIFFLFVAVVSLMLLSLILRTAIEKCFHDYVWTAQSSTHETIIKYFEDYYDKYKSWKNFDGKEIGEIAEKNESYFTITDPHGKLIWTTEDNITPCCLNPAHKYWRDIYPVMHNGTMAARINIGQFIDHIYSPDDVAFRRSIVYGIGISLAVTLLMALPLLFAASSKLSKPIRELKTAADEMSHGNLSVELDKNSSVKEISSLAESLDHLRKSLIKQENLRKQLSANISHELRTPLNIMQNQLEGMIDGVLPMDKDRLEGVLLEIERLVSMVREVEKITEVESDDFVPVCTEIDLSAAVKSVADGFEGAFKRKGLNLKVDLEKNIIVSAEKDKLTQVIMNLVSNAYKFTEMGTVSLKTYKTKQGAIFEITDTGSGISRDDIENIFERFYRIDKSRSRETGGAGLGLAIIKKIADAHGWKIETESEKGKGSLFRIIFQ